MKLKLILLLFIFLKINSLIEDEESLPVVSKLNSIEAIDADQAFKIKTDEDSIAYFDSFDKNSIIYISESYQDFISHQNEKRITGVLYKIEKGKTYYVRNSLYNSMSSFKKYLYPIKFAPEKIITLSGTNSFIYLEKNENNEKYSIQFDFEDVKVCLKLSEQSLESEVKFYDNTDIPITLRGLQYERLFTKKVYKVELISENAFIEFIKYNKQDLELKDESIKDYELRENEKKIAIIIKKTLKDFYFGLESTNEFTFSFSYGFTIKRDENDHFFIFQI